MKEFWEWLKLVIEEARRPQIDAGVLAGYEHAFKDQLRRLIRRTQNPDLRSKLERMLDCPIRDASGQCRSFTDYIVSALLKNGVHRHSDLEAALGYVVEKMLMDKGDDGSPRTTVFSGFTERPGETAGFNPLQARFLKYLQFAVNNIRKGKIVRLADAGQWPIGTVSIGQGRTREGDPANGVSPNEIVDRPSKDADLGEMVEDIIALLRRKEGAYGLPLAALFHAIMAGQRTDQQVKQFGDRVTSLGRPIIVQVIRDYAEKTENYRLLNLLKRFEGFRSNLPAPSTPKPTKAARPQLSDKERDYASIADVIARFERPVGSADLGKYRRRWLEYPPRTPGGGHRNRLEEVLAAMVRDGVLLARRTPAGAMVYSPGPSFDQYRRGVGAGV